MIITISPEIKLLAPGFRAMNLIITASTIQDTTSSRYFLEEVCQSLTNSQSFPWAHEHLTAWSEMYKKFGSKPQRTPCSAEALRKRVLRDGVLPSIDPIVDLYNAISLKYSIPIGGENIEAYQGNPTLKRASGNELFDSIKEGQPTQEAVDPGEVVWCDDIGVTCRKWNWRQGTRTRIDINTKKMWFILESLPEMPLECLEEAKEELLSRLTQIMPDLKIDSSFLSQP